MIFSGDSLGKVDPEEFKRLIQQGKTTKEIMEYFNISRWTLKYWERRLGLKAKRDDKRKVDPSKLKELLSKDLRISEIADYFDCC